MWLPETNANIWFFLRKRDIVSWLNCNTYFSQFFNQHDRFLCGVVTSMQNANNLLGFAAIVFLLVCLFVFFSFVCLFVFSSVQLSMFLFFLCVTSRGWAFLAATKCLATQKLINSSVLSHKMKNPSEKCGEMFKCSWKRKKKLINERDKKWTILC